MVSANLALSGQNSGATQSKSSMRLFLMIPEFISVEHLDGIPLAEHILVIFLMAFWTGGQVFRVGENGVLKMN